MELQGPCHRRFYMSDSRGARIDAIRDIVNHRFSNISNRYLRTEAYIHTHGVAQAAALIAMKRGENVELSVIAGLLHDIYRYTTGISHEHGPNGSRMAREIMTETDLFTQSEITEVCAAIYFHSEKKRRHLPFDEVLKDADVMQHLMGDPLDPPVKKDLERCRSLAAEFGLGWEEAL